MTLEELKKYIDSQIECSPGTGRCIVKVVVSEPGFPSTPSVGVKHAHVGIDWDSHQFMIYTEEKLIRKPKKGKKENLK